MDKPIIIPIVSPDVHWHLFIDHVAKITGRSPTRKLDLDGKSIGPANSFIHALQYFSKEHGNDLLNHCSYSFLITMDELEYICLLKRFKMHCTDNFYTEDRENIVIASATVTEWRSACLEFCTKYHSLRMRYMFDCIYIYLNGLNLFTLKKMTLPDESFTLGE